MSYTKMILTYGFLCMFAMRAEAMKSQDADATHAQRTIRVERSPTEEVDRPNCCKACCAPVLGLINAVVGHYIEMYKIFRGTSALDKLLDSYDRLGKLQMKRDQMRLDRAQTEMTWEEGRELFSRSVQVVPQEPDILLKSREPESSLLRRTHQVVSDLESYVVRTNVDKTGPTPQIEHQKSN